MYDIFGKMFIAGNCFPYNLYTFCGSWGRGGGRGRGVREGRGLLCVCVGGGGGEGGVCYEEKSVYFTTLNF